MHLNVKQISIYNFRLSCNSRSIREIRKLNSCQQGGKWCGFRCQAAPYRSVLCTIAHGTKGQYVPGKRDAPPKEKKSSRELAVKQLVRIEEEGAYIGQVNGVPQPATRTRHVDGNDNDDGDDLNDVGLPSMRAQQQASSSSSQVDQRGVTELVSGVTRWRRRLDYTLSEISGKSMTDLNPLVRQILRIALYELLFLGLAHHALSDHVTLCSTLAGRGPTSLVNSVLRKVAAALDNGSLPEPQVVEGPGSTPRQELRSLSIFYSHPSWMVSRWLGTFGREATVKLLQHNNRRPHYGLRANVAGGMTATRLLERVRAAGAEAHVSTLLPHEWVVVTRGLYDVMSTGIVQRGEASVQDEGAGLVVALLDPRPGDTLLDCCAAPGGKTLAAAQRMQGQGRIVAADISATKLKVLQDTARLQGVGKIIETVASDLRSLKASTAARELPSAGFSKVLLDTPCSGTGVLAKRADLRWRRTPEGLTQLLGLQRELLDAAAVWVAAGGLLVYSTCSIEPEECAEQVTAFLERHPDFFLEVPTPNLLPPNLVTKDGYMQALPHTHETDGAFAARLRKRDIN